MKHRLFIAITPPTELVGEIVGLQARLEKLNLPVHWEEPEKLHLTLNFLGKVDESMTGHLTGLISRTASNYQPFPLQPMFLETMYRKHDESFIYLGFGGDVGILKSIQKDLADFLATLKFSPPERYMPYITIGKLRKLDPDATKKALETINELEFEPLPDFTVNQISLYESMVSRQGSYYRIIGKSLLSS